MPAPESVRQLVQRFEEHLEAYRSGKYNETQLRREFLDPFFEALGWDVLNKLGYSEENKHVIHEDSLDVEGVKKAPDYAFKVGRERKFFVEAKKPSVKIETNPETAFQLRRYVWSAKLPLGILTDFEEFAVYECRSKPKVSDSVKTGRVLLFHYTDYIEKWDEIASVFSYDAVMKGGFDRFAGSAIKKKGTAEVDEAFLDEIEGWRETLARNIALRNREKIHNEADLNYAVQMTIDRIIFLRICEDRGFESENQLQNMLDPHRPAGTSPKSDWRSSDLSQRDALQVEAGRGLYEELKRLFEKADKRYNSGLFHFKEEKGRGRADAFTMGLDIDDKVLKEIVKDLYYPSPYVFSQIPADILGQIYEQFLGKVIRLTAGGNAKVEEKPEVRKAGGVFYTPTFIVDYIVANTLGRLLEGKTPEQVAKLKIVDPACGSGTFLLGAYQYLLDWHLNWYLNNDFEKWSKGKRAVLVQGRDGWKLNVEKKKEILLNNIYGVDIDPQAVEVTKLSLLLKVIEDPGQLSYLDERILPDLGRNIQCGNSLIGPDYWEGQLMVSEEDRARVNAFDWKMAFPEVFAQGGFDAVVGNPPYLRIQGLQENYGGQIEYFAAKYTSAVKRFDLYLLFIERSFQLLRKDGRLGFICPHKFINSDFGSGLRGFLKKNLALEKFISFGNNLIFEQASTYTGLLFLRNSPLESFEYYEFEDMPRNAVPSTLKDISNDAFTMYELKDFSNEPWTLSKKNVPSVLQALSRQPQTLGDVCEQILVGVQSGIDNVHVLKFESKLPNGLLRLSSEIAGHSVDIESDLVQPFLRGEDVNRYEEPQNSYYCIYPYKLIDGRTRILEETELKEKFPKGYAYLKEYKKELTEIRERQKTNTKYWYSCHRSRDMNVFESERIITPEISLGCNMTIAQAGLYHNTKVYSIVPSKERQEKKNYWLGLLNSRVMWWFLSNTGYVLRGGYFVFKTNYLQPFPVPAINFSDPADKARHDKMVTLVERMLALHKSLASAHNPQEADRLSREIESTDREIDGLVYELYGLNEEEIRIVEGN